MKPEEAVELLKNLKVCKQAHTLFNIEKEAVDMAIEALKKNHGECGTCKHYTKGGLDEKTYVCEHPSIDQDDYFNYAFITMDENDFCSCYEARKKEGGDDGEHQG